MRTAVIAAALVLVVALPTAAQGPEEALAPPTRLEALLARQGAVIVRGTSRIGEVRGREGALVAVDAEEVTDTASGDKAYGLAITVKGAGTPATERVSYLDYEELDALVRGLDTIAKVDRSATQLSEIRAAYRTRGGFEAATWSAGQQVRAAFSIGHRNPATAACQWADLGKLKDIVVQAKAALDALRQ